jgi:beta-methylmalyl-CoA/(S)-malyl-CoA lyase
VGRVERFEAAKPEGTGATTMDGQMVDEATFRTFADTVRTALAVDAVAPERATAPSDAALLERARTLGLSGERRSQRRYCTLELDARPSR